VEKFGANPSPNGAHEIDPTGEFSADYFEDFSIGLDTIRIWVSRQKPTFDFNPVYSSPILVPPVKAP
jgi:hypothetical protein